MEGIKAVYDYRIPSWAVCAIEYGDYTGLTDEEENSLHFFLSKLPKGGYFTYGEEYFSYYNDIDNLGGEVVDAKLTIFDNGYGDSDAKI